MTDHTPAAGHHDHDHGQHIMPLKVYYLIFAWLGVLTAITVAAAFVNFPTIGGFSLNFPVAMGIATTKAALVVMFFMHVKYSSKLVKLWIGASLVFFVILVAGILMDYFTRAGAYIAFYQPKL
jgi:cytochrome c oxidase subunit 4